MPNSCFQRERKILAQLHPLVADLKKPYSDFLQHLHSSKKTFLFASVLQKNIALFLFFLHRTVTMGGTSHPWKYFCLPWNKVLDIVWNYCTTNRTPSENSSPHPGIPSWWRACYCYIAVFMRWFTDFCAAIIIL